MESLPKQRKKSHVVQSNVRPFCCWIALDIKEFRGHCYAIAKSNQIAWFVVTNFKKTGC